MGPLNPRTLNYYPLEFESPNLVILGSGNE